MKRTQGIIVAVVAVLVLVIGSAGIVNAAKPATSITADITAVVYDDINPDNTTIYYNVDWSGYSRIASYDMTIFNVTDRREVKHAAAAAYPNGGWSMWAFDSGDHSGDTYAITLKLLGKNGQVIAIAADIFPRP